MIALPKTRIARVRKFLGNGTSDAARFEGIHRTLSQSFKVQHEQTAVAVYIGAIAYLFTGEPQDFERLTVEDGLKAARRIFCARKGKRVSDSLLLDHATRVLTAAGTNREGYADFEQHHLTLLGGELLFRRIVEALVQPYVDEPENREMTFAEAVFRDLSFWMEGAVVQKAIKTSNDNSWPEWMTAVYRNQLRSLTVPTAKSRLRKAPSR